MKKLVTLCVICLASICLYSQDIIVTMDEKKIDAKILEVSKTEVRYKELDNLEGPVFVIATSDINTIIYSSGKVSVFKHDLESEQKRDGLYTQGVGSQITKIDDYYYLADAKMTEEEYLNYIKLNCPEAWASYAKGYNLWKTGWGLFGVGIGLSTLVGVPLWVSGAFDLYNTGNAGLLIGGCTTFTIGCIASTACIPCLIVGGIKKNNSHKVYNEVCASKNTMSSLELDLQTSQNGIGFALKF